MQYRSMVLRAQPSALTACIAMCLLLPCEASMYVMKDEAGPELYYMHGKYRFFVSPGTIQDGFASLQLSQVSFRMAEATSGKGEQAKLHIALVPLAEFTDVVRTNVS